MEVVGGCSGGRGSRCGNLVVTPWPIMLHPRV